MKHRWSALTPEDLRRFREEHEVSKYALARALGVYATSISAWEHETSAPSPDLEARLVTILEAGTVDAVRPPGQPPSVSDEAVSAATAAIVCAYLRSGRAPQTTGELGELVAGVASALRGR